MDYAALRTYPCALMELQTMIHVAACTRLRRRVVAVDLVDGDTIFGGKVLKLQHKLPMGEVGHLTTPEGRHARELEIFNEDTVVLLTKLMGEMPLEGITLIHHLLMVSVKIKTFPFPVVGAWHTLREVPRLTLQ